MQKRPFLLMLLISAAAPGAQEFQAVRVEEAPSVDGYLTDAVWELARPQVITFTQFNPVYGEPVSEATEIRIIYDDDAIYFGFVLFDSLPDRMGSSLTPRDVYLPGDWIAILLDTFGEGREASSFEVNLAGSLMDSKINPYGEWDYSWDAVWECETSSGSEGWCAEYRIPFSALRFSDEEDQLWAVNFQRVIYRTGENGWCVLSCTHDQADIDNFAPLRGLHGLESPVGLELRPYGSGRVHHQPGEDGERTELDGGLDAKIGISSGLTADLTLNPDFGQVEADEEEMNLSYFETFLQEKRPFFMESSETFEMPFNMFYSRRIGGVAPNGEVIPIIGGAKASGTIGSDLQVGFLEAVTARVSEGDDLLVPLSNFGVLSLRQGLSSMSYVGVYGASKETPEQDGLDGSDYSRSVAGDFRLGLPSDLVLAGAVAGSWNRGSDDGQAYSMAFGRLGSGLFYVLESTYMTDGFDVNGTGYTAATDRITTDLEWHYTIRPERTFQWAGIGGHAYYQVTPDGDVTGRSVGLGPYARFSGGCSLELNAGYSGSRFEPYEGPEGHNYLGGFDFWIDGSTNWRAPLSLWAGVGGGASSHGGTYESYNASLTARPASSIWATLEAETFRTFGEDRYNWEVSAFDSRDTDWKSAVLHGTYLFNPEISLRLFGQYSRFTMGYDLSGESTTDQLRADVLLGWQFRPGSMFYLLLEHLMEASDGGDLGSPSYGAFAKLTWFLPV
ncbi:carbohydrate binding family 9 domain-containing protein [Candidatus Fermentibacterales bacterium]|nr:carbohydrate binding family 9 domain-containing protein [Candidatus Fermentibacterales bacterium]